MFKRHNVCVLAAVFVLCAGVSAEMAQTDDARHTIVGPFALRVKAQLTGLLTPVVIAFEGRGKADAQRSVLVDIGPLESNCPCAKARVELDALQRCGPAGNSFRGAGTAVVAVGNRTYKFRLKVAGRMYRTPRGARMVGIFVSPPTSDCPAGFRGRFAGPMIRPTAEAKPEKVK